MVKDFEADNPKIWVQVRPYTLFINNLPESSESVLHRRLDQDAIKAELEEMRTPLVGLPRVRQLHSMNVSNLIDEFRGGAAERVNPPFYFG